MSAIKRLLDEMIESENKIISLIDLAKERSPQLYKSVMNNPTMIKGSLLFSKFTNNEKLIRLAAFYLITYGEKNPDERHQD